MAAEIMPVKELNITSLIVLLNDKNAKDKDRISALYELYDLSKNPNQENAIYEANGIAAVVNILSEGTLANIPCSYSEVTYIAAQILPVLFGTILFIEKKFCKYLYKMKILTLEC